MQQADIGIIGLSVMGANLARNFESKGYTVAVFNRTASKTKAFANEQLGKNFMPAETLENFVQSLASPRKIMMMVRAGEAVDELIEQLIPITEAEDILIDGGNSYFIDTNRRVIEVEAAGRLYVGCGVSGGEEGALHGPSLMPGGSQAAWPILKPMLEKISAKVGEAQEPCCSWIGAGGAGHFIKMVHNGIEYADMQLISESYALIKSALQMVPLDISKVFSEWNEGPLKSYLIEITAKIFQMKDPEKTGYLIDSISDAAAQKGTGKWTAQIALDLGVPIPTIIEAVNARLISSQRQDRLSAKLLLQVPAIQSQLQPKELLNAIEAALYASKVIAYAQGFALIKAAAETYGWQLHFSEISQVWRGGCIIRAELLNEITKALETTTPSANLITEPFFAKELISRYPQWQQAIVTGIQIGLSLPAFSSAFAYFNAYRNDSLPTNLVQAQRDFFGAHTYERIDKPGTFHTEWET